MEIAYFDGSPSCLIPKIYHSPFQLVPTLAHENCLSPLYLQGAHNVFPNPNLMGEDTMKTLMSSMKLTFVFAYLVVLRAFSLSNNKYCCI